MKKKRLKKGFLTDLHTGTICTMLLLSIVPIDIVFAYDVTDAINAAIKNNIQLKNSKIKLEETKLGRFKAASSFLPTIGVQSNTSKDYHNGQDILPSQRQDVLSIQEEIFSGGKGIYNLKASAFANEAAMIEYQNKLDGTILQVIQGYEEVIATRNLYSVAIQNEKAMHNILEQSEVKLSIGAITKTDMLGAKARLADAISSKEKLYADMKNAEQNFFYVVGENAPKDMIDVDIAALPVPRDFEGFLGDIERANPSIRISEKIVKVKEFAVRSAKAELLPTVSVGASVQNARQYNNFGQKYKSTGEKYQLTFSLPIFRQGLEYINVKQSLLEEEAAHNSRDDTTLQVQKEAAKAWNNYVQGKFAVEADTDSVEYYNEFVRGINEEFYVGTKALSDLLQAQVNYERAKIKLIQDKAALVISALNLKYLLGEINMVDFSKLSVLDDEATNAKHSQKHNIENGKSSGRKKHNNEKTMKRIAVISDDTVVDATT